MSEDYEALYFELLNCITNKYEGVTKNETAKRILMKSQASTSGLNPEPIAETSTQ